MTDERAVRLALEAASLAVAIRRYTEAHNHTAECDCCLCAALAKYDRRGQA